MPVWTSAVVVIKKFESHLFIIHAPVITIADVGFHVSFPSSVGLFLVRVKREDSAIIKPTVELDPAVEREAILKIVRVGQLEQAVFHRLHVDRGQHAVGLGHHGPSRMEPLCGARANTCGHCTTSSKTTTENSKHRTTNGLVCGPVRSTSWSWEEATTWHKTLRADLHLGLNGATSCWLAERLLEDTIFHTLGCVDSQLRRQWRINKQLVARWSVHGFHPCKIASSASVLALRIFAHLLRFPDRLCHTIQ
mmetsp:Transcript_16395/g.30225  ORF Transcript_16395/g.30225 Transcript_16395/m.30225 type:complete len:250 (+) Transcript_16395:1681-2430(+)